MASIWRAASLYLASLSSITCEYLSLVSIQHFEWLLMLISFMRVLFIACPCDN